jgi:CRISPR-associated protein Cmr3
MSAVEYRFVEPLDVLFLRGNKLFGDPGSYGESLVPPWPSAAAGALRSRMLADDGVDFAAFAAGKIQHPALGTPVQPGAFAVAAFHLARRYADGRVEVLIAPPADLVITEVEDGKPASVRALKPTQPAPGLLASTPFALLPVLAEDTRGKPTSGYWLTEAGWRAYLTGATPKPRDLIKAAELWRIDPRVGVGLDAATRRAANGRLFSVQAVAMKKRKHAAPEDFDGGFDVGFLAGVTGAEPPRGGTLRLGGDGRAAAVHSASIDLPEPDYGAIADARRCRLVLATPGIFPEGWKLPGTDADGFVQLGAVKGRVVCAAVPRAEVVSGWDLAAWSQGKGGPKPAQRAAPTGSVYWLDELDAAPEALRKLAEQGLWKEACDDPQRRAEGFNRFTLAAY